MIKSKKFNMSVMTKVLIAIFFAANTVLVAAMPKFARQYKQQYGYSPSCHACHKDGGGTPLNNYGKTFEDKGKNVAAFALMAELDSDGDGAANAAESGAKSNPGDSKSTLEDHGDWLDLSSLIPKEVQVLFPEAEAWKPLDASLTEKDIAAAQNLGAALSKEDENTIYIPVANQRPIGTALIFPVNHQDKTFFLLMATDRQLNITKVLPLSSDSKAISSDNKIFPTFSGLAVQDTPAASGGDLEASIQRAVKKAGVLVLIRLKGA